VIDLSLIATNLERGADGLWWPRTRTAVDYPDEGNAFCFQIEDHSFWFRYRNAYVVDAVGRFPPAGPIFDIGGGNGFVARGLAAAGFPTIVVEPGPTGARNAQARGLSPVICAALDDAGFRPGSLPAAGFFDVLEHIEDDRAAVASLSTLLPVGGRVYLTVPAYQWLWSSEDDLGGHHRRYTRASLARLFARAGFIVEHSTYIFWPLPLPILLVRVIPARLGIRPKVDLDAIRNELKPKEGIGVRALTSLLDVERWWLARGGIVPFGGSCLMVARKA
jgi:SAM-dependent methyltransferase